MSVKFFKIGHLRKLMPAKLKNGPSTKVYVRNILKNFSHFLIFHLMLKFGLEQQQQRKRQRQKT